MPLPNYVITRATDFGGPYCLSPTFGHAVCSITTAYNQGAIVFSAAIPGQSVFGTATTTEAPTTSWGGINGSGDIDLFTPVSVQVVLPSTTTQATTGYIAVEAGFAFDGALLLSVYGVDGSLIASRPLGLDGLGPHGRKLMVLGVPPFASGYPPQMSAPFSGTLSGIGFFMVADTGVPLPDTFLINQIWMGDTAGLIAIACPTGSGVATVGEPFTSNAPVVTGGTGPFTYTLASGPAWMVIDPATGIVSGTPPSKSTFTYTIEVTDSLGATATTSPGCSLTTTCPPQFFPGTGGNRFGG